ncbi:hypothetical protein [Olleya marilimosa]|uniref:hypothetical protein n=1 Tax=Olleya marilimosa TaxID=272164 RepID=UPI0030EB5023|tara:strand:+ start:2432 stop:4846 length:2415 start_codon:yes stop_codon:yes gene_type:complete
MKNKIYNPNPLAKWSDKLDPKYGLAYAQLIVKDWFKGSNGKNGIADDCEYANRRDYIINKRLMARGEQDAKAFKDHMARQEGSEDYLNLDWRIINISGKFCRVVSNGIRDDYYNLDIRANDRHTLLRKKEKMDERRNTMRAMPMLKQVKEKLNLDLIPKGFIPADEKELQLYSEIEDRPKIEIAEEIIIKYIKDTNDFEVLENQKNKDLVEVGISSERTWTDPINGVQFEYVDPEYLVHSYVRRNDFSDAYYYAYIDEITIDDIKRESDFDDDKIRKIANAYMGLNKRYDNTSSCRLEDLLDYKVNVVRYCFKTSKTDVWKANKKDGKVIKAKKRDENYNPPERADYGKISRTKDTWIEGTHILDSEYVYNHKECENIIRDERNKAISPFGVQATDIYKNKLRSFQDDIEPLANQMQYTHLKIQHLQAELKPDLTVINQDALADLSGSGDQKKMWTETLNLLNVKGVVIEKAVDMGEMGIQNKQAARPSASPQGSALAALLNTWAHYYNVIRETTGVNPARDGSLPADALLGVNQMAQLASNTATQHIVDASIRFNKALCEKISSRIHNIFKSKSDGAKKLKEMYERAVGKQNLEALEVMADRHLHDFGFTVNMIPTQRELKEFSEDLSISLQEGLIDVEVKHEAQRIARTNMKLASQYLFYMRGKRRTELMEERAKESQIKSKNDIAAANAARQAEVKAYGIKTQMDLKKESQMAQIEVFKEQGLLQIKEPTEQRKFQQEVFLKQLEVASNFELNKFKEQAKDDRVDKQSTQQSKMIKQRKPDAEAPIDFTNTDIFKDIFRAS